MRAMIFAAGLGTRLQPLTNNKPKALVTVNGTPLLEIAINNLKSQGVTDIIINVHHFADQIISFVKEKNHFGINIQFSEEKKKLLNTGGGLKKALPFFDDGKPFIIWNADIISTVDLAEMLKTHQEMDAIATLLTRKRETSRYLIFDENNVLTGWTNLVEGKIKLSNLAKTKERRLLAFGGIHIVSPEIIKYMPDKKVFSIIDVYLEAAKKEKLIAFVDNDIEWIDVGRVESVEKAGTIMRMLSKNDRL